MTIIQPNKNAPYLTYVLWVLAGAMMTAAVCLVFTYNRSVNLAHSVESLREEAAQVRTATAELKEGAFALMDSEKFKAVAKENGLVEELSPAYVEVSSLWSIASVSHY